jgi:hypothetical protein
MKRLFQLAFGLLLAAFLIGCAHPITMNPDLGVIKGNNNLISKSVGYHIPDSAKAVEVTTGGGGGDKVRYFPYRDLEPGFYKALTEVFAGVSKIQNPKDNLGISNSGISLLITPEIHTISSSDSPFTWPPTQFTVDLICTVTDSKGQAVDVVRVSGYGQATFDEFKSNFSLAAVRASNNALNLLIKALSESPQLRQYR